MSKSVDKHPGRFYTIDIDTTPDDHAVVAVIALRVPGEKAIFYTGSSKREPGDRRDAVVGEQLAVSRALRALADDLAETAEATVKATYGEA